LYHWAAAKEKTRTAHCRLIELRAIADLLSCVCIAPT
jgi:hypothetical protein